MDFTWNGSHIHNVGNVLDVISAIETKKEADDFLMTYASNIGGVETAKHNIGWLSAELNDEKRRRVCELFGTVHPVIGNPITVTDKALKDAAGRLMWGSHAN
jgi:hypothetical protein